MCILMRPIVWYWVQYVAHYIVLNKSFFWEIKKYAKYCTILNEKWSPVNKNIYKMYNLCWPSCLVLKNQHAGLKLIKIAQTLLASAAAFPFLFVNFSLHHCIHFPFSKQNVKKWGVVLHCRTDHMGNVNMFNCCEIVGSCEPSSVLLIT